VNQLTPAISPINPVSPGSLPPGVVSRIEQIGDQITKLAQEQRDLAASVGILPDEPGRLDIFHSYIIVLGVAFMVTLLATPIMRRLAIAFGIVDRPSEARKIHRAPTAYLGGAAVYVGIMAGILISYIAYAVPGLIDFHQTSHLSDSGPAPVPLSILFGLTIIMLVGLIDDVHHISPNVKVAGQLLAAACLAIDDVGVRVAKGVLMPVAHAIGIPTTSMPGTSIETIALTIPLPSGLLGTGSFQLDLIYWAGTAIIAIFVLGACNASNLIDGLDGLLSGVTAIANIGLLVVALSMAVMDDGPRDAQRLVLCMAVIGACLGFLPHNFNPATIFLGDCGSLLLGFATVVVILTLGDTGKTNLVFAGLIIYSIPIIDTSLAIVRRKLAGKRMSDPDADHLHHMLKRGLGVKGAVLTLYAIGLGFALIGIGMSLWRARATYLIALVYVGFIAVIAIKIARKKAIEEQAIRRDAALATQGPTPHPIAPTAGAASHPSTPEPSPPPPPIPSTLPPAP
jgi:UDP-GlcNAc:undecaprenyl-phosphate GlcNAc-1-phosphate transferase